MAELLRLEGPVRLAARVALAGHVVGGRSVRAGEQVVVRVDAADRDPWRFADPESVHTVSPHDEAGAAGAARLDRVPAGGSAPN